MNKARAKKVLLALAVFIVGIQVVQPRRTNPPVSVSRTLPARVRIPKEVYTTLIRSCGDCHSDQTRWPWYSRVAPFSWVITDDVNEGRRNMNFEDWEALGDGKLANDRLIDICSEIKQKGMPLFSYRIFHGRTRLDAEEISSICAWSGSVSAKSTSAPASP